LDGGQGRIPKKKTEGRVVRTTGYNEGNYSVIAAGKEGEGRGGWEGGEGHRVGNRRTITRTIGITSKENKGLTKKKVLRQTILAEGPLGAFRQRH